MRVSTKFRVFTLIASALCACARYQPRPLEPDEMARQFDQRSIAAPDLCAYLRANLAAKAATCPPAKWDLAALTLVGFYYNPSIAVAQARVRAAEAGIVTAGARPNPVVGLGPQYDVRSSPNFVPWAIGMFSLNMPIETAGKRGYRIAQAKRIADATRLSAGETAWTVRSHVREALVRLMLDTNGSELAAQRQDALAAAAQMVSNRVATGYAPAFDLDLAQSALQNARRATAQAEARVPADRNALAAAIGVPADAIAGARFAWDALDNPPAEQQLNLKAVQRIAILNRIDLRVELAQYAAADEALKLEIAKQYPDLNLGGGYSWEGGENIFELGPSIALPVFNQNQGPIAQAEARRDELAAQFLKMQSAIIAQSRIALIAYRGALAGLAAARAAADYQARRNRQAARALVVGETDSLTAGAIGLQNLAAQQATLQSLKNTRLALGALEDSMQRPLGKGASRPFTFPPPRHSEAP